ncbi:MAG: metallophosphoesterase [Thermoguttaceae bacterium]|jgi:hypothetical protein|nr:metallophosphoesterase [Thermoguttaceae bacterium]
MSIIIAQLGDMHFRHDDDPGFVRAPQIGAAIAAEASDDVATIVLAICGDAAHSGLPAQFRLAVRFIESIESAIRSRNANISVQRVVIPGNHDCDFSGDQAARDLVLRSLTETAIPPGSIQGIILQPLSAFFAFSQDVAGIAQGITRVSPFYNAVDVRDGAATIRIHLLNTAWMSSLHELPGSLLFPIGAIQPPSKPAECSVAILHHPTRWFAQPQAMRPLRDRVGELASIVLVNHEHVAGASEHRELFGFDGEASKVLYISGGVIQEADTPLLCSFNLLRLSVSDNTLDLSRYEHKEAVPGPYFAREATEALPLSSNERNRGASGYSLSEGMAAFLEDPGAPVSHPRRDPRLPVRLSDIFLYPDLWELDAQHEGSGQKQIRSPNVAEEVLKPGKVLITGGEKSGRTSLMKRLFQEAFQHGKTPLLLNGGELPKNPKRLREVLRNAVKEQFSNLSADAFEQLPQDERVVLIDDIHRMPPSTSLRESLLSGLEERFSTVVVCGDDLIKLDELKGRDGRNSGLWEYRHLILLGFGEYLREQFVRQWLMLAGDTVPDEWELESEVDRFCGVLNAVIRKQLLPAYPLFLIVVLQQADISNASVQGGSFGHLFEGVITAILSKSRFGRISIGDKYHYLAAFAKWLYDGRSMVVSVDAMEAWHDRYWDEIELCIDFRKLLDDFTSLAVLSVNGTEVRFKYAYFFCFFVAYYLNQSVHENATRQVIGDLCKQLHHRVSADIVLFLAHLTGDPIVLNEMMRTCEGLFRDVVPASLDNDVEALNRLGQTIEAVAIPDSPDENRRQLRLRHDELIAERLAAVRAGNDVEPPEPDDESVQRLFDIHAAYKTIQILGQALRNMAGSASRETKEEVLDRVVGLARRVLASYFELFAEASLPALIEDVAMAHKEEQPTLTQSDIHNEVCRHLLGLSQFVCFAVVKHTTFCVASENLAPTIHRVLDEGQDVASQVFGLSFDLERPGRFPKNAAVKLYRQLNKNDFVAGVVRTLVAYHMYMYVVPYNDRQSVCQQMSIKLLPAVMDSSRKRLTK